MAQENVGLPGYIASAARTTDHVGAWFTNEDHQRLHVIVNVSAAAGSTATFTPSIEAKVPATTQSYDLLVGTAISSTGRTVLKVGPGIAASANAAAQDMVPAVFRVTSTHAGAGSLTYSVDLNLGI